MSALDEILTTSPVGYWPCDQTSGAPYDWVGGNDLIFGQWDTWGGQYVEDDHFGWVLLGPGYQDRWDYSATLELYEDTSGWGGISINAFMRRHPEHDGPIWETQFHFRTLSGLNHPSLSGLIRSGSSQHASFGAGVANWPDPNLDLHYAPWSMPDPDVWVPVTMTYDHTTGAGALYVSGVEVDSGSVSPPTLSPATGFSLSYQQRFAHLALWDRALTPAEVYAIHAKGVPPEPPPMPTAYLWDDFDRPDGPLGTALTGQPWVTPGASWVIDSGSARPEIDALNPIAFLSLPGVQVESAEVTVTIPPGWDSFSSAELGVGAEGSSESPVVMVKGNGEVWDGERTVWGGGFQAHPRLGVVDVSPGPHTLTVTRAPGPDGDMWIAVWWDGLPLSYRPAATGRGNMPSGPWVALYSDRQGVLFDDLKVTLAPVRVPFSEAPPLARTGVRSWPYPADVLYMPFTDAPSIDSLGLAPDLALSPHLTGPIFAPFTDAPPLHGGVHSMWSDTPAEFIPEDPASWPPGVQYGRPTAAAAVSGFPFRTVQECQPQLNAPGSGSFTCVPPGPGLGSLIRYTAGGGVVFTGRADTVETVVAASGEESQQLVTVTTPGAIEPDWTQTVVFPDLGAFEPDEVGQPAQDDRTFGFPMVGLEVPGLTWEASAPGDREKLATEEEKLPIPDAWPDFTSEYMWVTDPDVDAQPPGWCFFRKEVATWPGEYALFVNSQGAWTRVWVDGAPVITIEKPGETKRVDLPFGWGGSHLIAIESFAQGGVPAAINLTMMMRHASGFGFLAAQSGAGWECLPYPTISMRAPVGKVLRRLLAEASARGAPAGRWAAGFSDLADSNGRSWPTGDDAPLITIRVGSTYMDVLNQLTEALIDWHASPSGSTLMAYVKDSAIGSASLPWTLGVDAEAWTNRVSGS